MGFAASYRSTTVGRDGCFNQILSVPREEYDFPVSVNANCSLCNKRHSFSRNKIYSFGSKRQLDAMVETLERNGYQVGVKLV